MPYARKWIPAVMAIAHVIRADRCDKSAAMRQLEAAAREGALRWFRAVAIGGIGMRRCLGLISPNCGRYRPTKWIRSLIKKRRH